LFPKKLRTGVSSLKFQKPDKKNVLVQIWRNICDSNHGLLIMLRESSTVQRLIPLEIAVGIVAGLLVGFIPLEFIILAVVAVVVFTTETANSAIEEVNDLVTEEYSERVKRSKDMASASVWIWHLMYIICFVFFLVCHLVHFTWWTHIIPG